MQNPLPNVSNTRIYMSTEAQTEESGLTSETVVDNDQLHRRTSENVDENRTRNSHNRNTGEGILPDILNNHVMPQYPPISANQFVRNGAHLNTATCSPVYPPQVPFAPGTPLPFIIPVTPSPGGRLTVQNSRRLRNQMGITMLDDQPHSKWCCTSWLAQPVPMRWFIILIASVGVCCMLVGTTLGALKASGRDHLTISLLMIGVGIILITVSGVAWRLTSQDASCESDIDPIAGNGCARRFMSRLPPSTPYGRASHHPYSAMMYPEFQYRPPPPNYQASMQEYRLRLLLLDRLAPVVSPDTRHSLTPPPTYRSHAGTLMREPYTNHLHLPHAEYSCPPSYRSRSSMPRSTIDPTELIPNLSQHSPSNSESNKSIVDINTTNTIKIDNLKTSTTVLNEDPMSSSGEDMSKNCNLVTIVQTGNDQSPVIVTVSGSQIAMTNSRDLNAEMEILTHT